ncbi:MAG: GNAT family N-acetyltransferase [Actinobacteria bacterium]|nr:GNAT family N-acetyltransferase [Actinomycetota bacterium]
MNRIVPSSSSFTSRLVAREDAPEIMRIVNAAVWSDVGMRLYRDGDLAKEWAGRDPSGLLAIETPTDGIVGFVSFEPEDDGFYFEGFVDPPHEGRGIGTMIADLAEARAFSEARRRGSAVTVTTNVGNEAAQTLFESRGWDATVDDVAMFYDLTGDVPEPIWPEGASLRPYREDVDDELMWETMRAGFGSDWPATSRFETWIEGHRGASGYSEDLWWFAEKDGEIVATTQCRETWHAEDTAGWIKNLAVLPAARNSGVGRAMLFEAFRRLQARGRERAVLGVNLNNPTDAHSFYLRVGMTPAPDHSADLTKTFTP